MSADTTVLYVGDTWTIPVTGLPSLVGRLDLRFAIRQLDSEEAEDTPAYIMVGENVGLEILMGLDPEEYEIAPALAEIDVEDDETGAATLHVSAVVTRYISSVAEAWLGWKVYNEDGSVATAGESPVTIRAPIVAAIAPGVPTP